MTLQRGPALLIGILTAIPGSFVVFHMFYAMPRLYLLLKEGEAGRIAYLEFFNRVYSISLLILVLSVALLIFYVVFFRRAPIPPPKRTTWAVALLTAGIFIGPLFWYYYIWRPAVVARASVSRGAA